MLECFSFQLCLKADCRILKSCLNFRTLPAFVWHRQDWSIVFPLTHLEDLEINELKGRQTYVAGFLDPTVEERTDLYDIFVNCKYNIEILLSELPGDVWTPLYT